MLLWIAAVLGCQLAGELLAVLTGLPVPGPVMGMLLLLAYLVHRGGVPEELDALAGALLRHLYLYFVPAAVGVTAHFLIVRDQLLPILVALVVSSALALAVAGLLVQALARRDGKDVL